MKTTPTLLLLFFSYFGFTQTLSFDSGTTRAVIIGISDYQDENIPDLQFANRDAEAFAAFLQSPGGGNIPSDHIMLLTNKSATTGAMAGAMDWLIEKSQEGDKAIIYFSGHGDVETRTRFQRGFLLTYDSPPSNYLAGAFALIFLQDIITTLSEQGVQVIMISDACRAGKLAGSEIGGSQATAANLSKQFANEIKILSCQANEFSLEGEQWGGGRGVFSYHLIDGLTGLADNNEDLQVNLLEINRFLEEVVPTETAPQMQIPMVVGNKGTVLTHVDESSLAQIKERKENALATISPIETKGFEEIVLTDLDSIWRQKYEQFTVALENGDLLEPQENNAYDLYEELSKVPELERLHGLMKRNLATALQDESQQTLNALLRSDNKEIAAQQRGEAKYNKFVRYLEKAAELLGSKHYMYKTLKAKQYYFEAVDIQFGSILKAISLSDSSDFWHAQAKAALQKSLDYEPNAAFTHIYMAYYAKGNVKHEHFQKAIELAPQWAFAYVVYGYHYFQYAERQDLKKADSLLNIAIRLNPNLSHAYQNLGLVYYQQNKLEQAEAMLKKALALSPGDIHHLMLLGWFYREQKKYAEAEKFWLRALELSPNDMRFYNNLSQMYFSKTLEYDKAEAINRERLEKRPTDGDAYSDLVTTYTYSKQYSKLEPLIEEMKTINSSVENWEGVQVIGDAYLALGEVENAVQYYQVALKAAPTSLWVHANLARVYFQSGDYENCLIYLDTAFLNGLSYSWVEASAKIWIAYKTPGFKRFAQKIIDNKPDLGFGYSLMGKYYEGINEMKTAEDFHKKATTLSPERKAYWFEYGKFSYLMGQTKKSDELFKRFIEASSKEYWNYTWVGEFYRIHGEIALAKAYFEQALKVNPVSEDYFINLAWMHYDNDAPEKAHLLLDIGIELQTSEGEKAGILFTKAMLYYYSENIDESIIYLQQSEKQLPALRGISTLFIKLKEEDWIAAANIIDELLKLDADSPEGNHVKCRIKIKQGLLEEAIAPLSIAMPRLSYDFLQNDKQLDPLRGMPEFKALMKQYFPEKFK